MHEHLRHHRPAGILRTAGKTGGSAVDYVDGLEEEMIETKENKPFIRNEARERIKLFVLAVEALQKKFGIELCTMDDSIAFFDTKRTDDWGIYGDYSAFIFKSEEIGRMRAKNIKYEQFNLWGT
jgi:hypothetical protein